MMHLQPASSVDNDGKLLENDAQTAANGEKAVYILCNMGMTGFFEAVPCLKEKHRHAHLSFQATDGSILSYVDVRRFGTWRSFGTPEWPADRGPDPVKEHEQFRKNVVASVAENPKRFDKVPICQVLHDQSLFNGIGNYLRAEILLRAGIEPFSSALEILASMNEAVNVGGQADLLTLCRDVPSEVINLSLTKYQGGNPSTKDTSSIGPSGSMAPSENKEYEAWQQWLRVYGHTDASWAVDKEGRRIWFRGPPGKLYRKFTQKGCLQGKKHFVGAVGIRKKPAAYMMKKPSSASAKTTRVKVAAKTRILKRPASAAKRK
jgi:formamidopyrimidine-DNA glycosylase